MDKMKEEKVELGDTVKDMNTGFKGVVVCRSEYINGCVQYEVVPKVDKDNKQSEAIQIDEQCLIVVKKKKKPIVKEDVGGSYRKGTPQRGY